MLRTIRKPKMLLPLLAVLAIALSVTGILWSSPEPVEAQIVPEELKARVVSFSHGSSGCGSPYIAGNLRTNRELAETVLLDSYPIEGNDNSNWFGGTAAVYIHDQWELMKVRLVVSIGSRGQLMSVECPNLHATGYALYVDDSMTAEDIVGATITELNDDGDGIIFKHTRPGTHRDLEIAVMGGLAGIFTPLLTQYQVDEALATTTDAETLAKDKFVLASEFYGKVVTEARERVRKVPLGGFHTDPHPEDGHVYTIVKDSVEAVKAKWTKDRSADLGKLAGAVTYLTKALRIPDAQTRAEQAAATEE